MKNRKDEEERLRNQGPTLQLTTEQFTYNSRFVRQGRNILHYKFSPDHNKIEDEIVKYKIPNVIIEESDLRDGFDQCVGLKSTELNFNLVRDTRYLERSIPTLSLWDIIERLYIKRNMYCPYEDNCTNRWEGYDLSEIERISKLDYYDLVKDVAFNLLKHIDMIFQLYFYQDCSGLIKTTNFTITCEEISQKILARQSTTPVDQLDQWCIVTAKTWKKGYNVSDGTADVYKNLVKRVSHECCSLDIGNSCKSDDLIVSTAMFASAKVKSIREKNPPHKYVSDHNGL